MGSCERAGPRSLPVTGLGAPGRALRFGPRPPSTRRAPGRPMKRLGSLPRYVLVRVRSVGNAQAAHSRPCADFPFPGPSIGSGPTYLAFPPWDSVSALPTPHRRSRRASGTRFQGITFCHVRTVSRAIYADLRPASAHRTRAQNITVEGFRARQIGTSVLLLLDTERRFCVRLIAGCPVVLCGSRASVPRRGLCVPGGPLHASWCVWSHRRAARGDLSRSSRCFGVARFSWWP